MGRKLTTGSILITTTALPQPSVSSIDLKRVSLLLRNLKFHPSLLQVNYPMILCPHYHLCSLECLLMYFKKTYSDKSYGWRSIVGYSPWGRKESDTTEQLNFIQINNKYFNSLLYLTSYFYCFFLKKSLNFCCVHTYY